MIELISSLFSEGDRIRVFYNNSNKSVEGIIYKILSSSIAIKTIEGKICGVKGDDIVSFEQVSDSLENTNEQPVGAFDSEQIIDSQCENQIIPPQEALTEACTASPALETNSCISQSQYKVGDIIPLEGVSMTENHIKKIAKREDKMAKHKPQVFKSLEALASLDSVVEARSKELEFVVRELGKIIQCGYSFGFISDYKTGGKLWFSLSELIGISCEDPVSLVGTYVVYTRSQNDKGNTAISVHRPDTISNIVNLAKQQFDAGKRMVAYELLNHILCDFPDSYLANNAMLEFSRKKQKKSSIPVINRNPEQYYKEAKDYYERKDYGNAILSYKKAIKEGSKVESAIKDLGMLLISLSKKSENEQDRKKYQNEARELMENYVHFLPDNNGNLSYLENFYYAIRDFEKFKQIANRLLSVLDKDSDGPRYVFLLNKLAAAHIKEGNTEKARELLSSALEIYPDSMGAMKLLEIIDIPQIGIQDRIEEEIKSLDVNDYDSYNEGLTIFIEQTLLKYEEYAGVKAKDTGNFTKKTLGGIRDLIDTFDEKKFSGRPNERARYLLTEGKLMQQLEPDNTFGLRSVMARYCNDMAKINIYNSSPTDVIRFYYSEAFALEENYRSTAQQVSYYLLAIIYDHKTLSDEINKSISVDNALGLVIGDKYEQRVWENILNMVLYNKDICAQIVSKLFESSQFRNQSLMALKSFGVDAVGIKTKEEYLRVWNRAREKRIGEYRQIIASMKSISNTNNIEEISIRLSNNFADCRKEWMCSTDLARLTQIVAVIAPALEKFHKASDFRSKQLNCHEVTNLLNQMIDEISKWPTKLSYEAILPLLEQVLIIVNDTFENILAASKPVPKISLLRTETVVDQKLVPLQIEVAIGKDSSPIYNVKIEIVNNDEIEVLYDEDVCSYPGLIEGGETHIFQPTVRVSDYVLEKKAVAFVVKCSYTNAGEDSCLETNLSLHLYNPEEFSPIANPYAIVAESGPLSADSKMFYGQKEYIQLVVNTILESPSKQVIIYGQKRSGKSSVLNKVQQELTSAGAFCVQFSMGKIVRNISEVAFYYKILTEIQDSLELLAEDGMPVPNFSIPSRTEFSQEDQENPVETFTKYMRAFKRACKKEPTWENKRLVVLIDEFTYMYGAIKMHKISPTIMMQWKAITQDEYAQFSVVLVGQDVIPAFKNEPYARNAFGVIKDLRLSYLKEDEARDLIINPISENGYNRYNDNAVDLIMEYTACSPYYIQIFCSYLVNYMNEKHYNSVTEADVLAVVEELICGVNALDPAKFENLLSSGETDTEGDVLGTEVDDAIKMFSDSDVESVLKAVAKASSTKSWAARTDISTSLSKETESSILKQLKARDVLDDKDDENYYRIKVRLYKEWLLKH